MLRVLYTFFGITLGLALSQNCDLSLIKPSLLEYKYIILEKKIYINKSSLPVRKEEPVTASHKVPESVNKNVLAPLLVYGPMGLAIKDKKIVQKYGLNMGIQYQRKYGQFSFSIGGTNNLGFLGIGLEF